MSKCWYCNEELTTGNNPEHIGICNECYKNTFGYGNEFVRNMIIKTIDLETKLAESEKRILELQEDSIRDNQIYNEELAEQRDLIRHLKKQLNCDYYKPCPRCNNPYGSSQFPSKDENGKDMYVCSNCNEKELFYEPLIKQLEEQNDKLIKQRDDADLKLSKLLLRVSEQNEELANRPTTEDLYPPQMIKLANQDKISFAVEQLEQLKYSISLDNADEETGDMSYVVDTNCLFELIDNQIKQLKEENYERNKM